MGTYERAMEEQEMKGHRQEAERKTVKCQQSMGRVDKNRNS